MNNRLMILAMCGIAITAVSVDLTARGALTSISDAKLPAGEFPFLSSYSVPFKQTKANWFPNTSQAQLNKNKQVVLKFYQGDMDVLADDFIEHDPGEPSTKIGWTTFIHDKHPAGEKPREPVGFTPSDSAGHGLVSMIAEGDVVAAVRRKNVTWPDGPTPVYETIFVDIWRVKDGKLAEQWVTTLPSDAVPALIQKAKDKGYWNKDK